MQAMMNSVSHLSFKVIAVVSGIVLTGWIWIPLVQPSIEALARMKATVETIESGGGIQTAAIDAQRKFIEDEIAGLNRAITDMRAGLARDGVWWDKTCGLAGILPPLGEACQFVKDSRLDDAEAELLRHRDELYRQYDELTQGYRPDEPKVFQR